MGLVVLPLLLFTAVAQAQTPAHRAVESTEAHPGATHLVSAEVGVAIPLVELEGFTHRFVGTVGLRAVWAVRSNVALGLRVNLHHALIPYENDHDGYYSLSRGAYHGTIEDKLTLFPTFGFAVAFSPVEWFSLHGTLGAGHIKSFAWEMLNNFIAAAIFVYPVAGVGLDFALHRSEGAEIHIGAEADLLGIYWAELPLLVPRGMIGVRL